MSTHIVGWDIGGAHVKACWLQDGQVRDVVQWACPLWLGLQHLAAVLQAAQQRWPQLGQALHAVTMTGEMADLFTNRADGVQRIAAALARQLGPATALQFYAADDGWCSAAAVARHWRQIASANWLATARHVALALQQRSGDSGDSGASGQPTEALLVDIGSTTTDLIAVRNGAVLTSTRSDHQRLASAELVYHGVVRTPLCVLAQQVPWQGRPVNVMNELFATTADVYRLTAELDPVHDQQPAADGGAKTAAASRQRLARLIGLDRADGTAADWLALAQVWRGAQVATLQVQLARVVALHGLGQRTLLVTAGCGDFLAPDLLPALTPAPADGNSVPARARWLRYADLVAPCGPPLGPASAAGTAVNTTNWAQVCASAVAVAALRWFALQPSRPGQPAPSPMPEPA